MGVAVVIRQAFEDARFYAAPRTRAAEGEPFPRDLGRDARPGARRRARLGPARAPPRRHRDRIRLAEEFGYRLVLNHGTEGHKIADVLAEKGIPVIFGPMFTSRSKLELRDRAIVNLATLAGAGVRVAITTDHPVVPIDFLVHQASLAVKEGLDRRQGAAGPDHQPGRDPGARRPRGVAHPGLDGDVVVWSGDPLDG